MRKKQWKYHKSHSYTHVATGEKVSMASQQYQVGTYVILNNNPSLQLSVKPSSMVSVERRLNKMLELGEISDLEFGPPITVEEVDGLYKVKEEG